jgi:hypothetical protein
LTGVGKGFSGKNVTFDVLEEIVVKHWQRAEMKKVHIPHFTSDLWVAFQLNIVSTFADEIDNKPFRIYALPQHFENINQRRLLNSVDDLKLFLEEYTTHFMVGRPQLYVWNEESGTPDKPPRQTTEVDKLSSVTKNSTESLRCKERDKNACVFCGYTDGAKRQASHILELRYFKEIPTEVERDNLLESLGLESINSLANLISLCEKCHRQFDKNKIGIEPDSKTLVVADEILDDVTQGYIPFSQLQGKSIIFNGIRTRQPSAALLKHRFDIFAKSEIDLSALNLSGDAIEAAAVNVIVNSKKNKDRERS